MEQTAACTTAKKKSILLATGTQPAQGQMLDHLLDFDPEVAQMQPPPLAAEKATPSELLDAKVKTADWLKQKGGSDAETVISDAEKQRARETFAALTTAAPIKTQHELVSRVETPAAVRHLVSMLTAYDWAFIEQAQQIRSYAVAKLLEDCESPKDNTRLKALSLLGRVSEIGLFTDKIEVKKTDLTEAEIDAKLKEKLAKFMDVTDVDVVDVDEKPANPDA